MLDQGASTSFDTAIKVDAAINLVGTKPEDMFRGWHSKDCERATRAIGGMQSSMRATTVIIGYCDQPASRVQVGIRLVVHKTALSAPRHPSFMSILVHMNSTLQSAHTK